MIHENIELTGSFIVSGSFVLPSHPNTGSVSRTTGSMYHDTTDNILKVYTGNAWVTVGEQTTPTPPVVASTDIEYLLVAGGGAGGTGFYGAGGGAGGYLSSSIASVTSGSSFTVTVGSGGATGGTTAGSRSGGDGNDSSIAGATISTITSNGGGGGGGGGSQGDTTSADKNAQDGGSGGGAAQGNPTVGTAGSGTVGQGNDGGTTTTSGYGAGGGGASAAGGNGDSSGGNGGDGKQSSITGTATYYAGGGGGADNSGTGGTGGQGGGATGDDRFSGSPGAGTANTGGGGAGAGDYTETGGAGGSGVAIFAYDSGSFSGLGGVKSSRSDGYVVHTFNSSGTLTVGGPNDNPIIPQNNFETVLYSGTSSTQSITSLNFQPDFVLLRSRTQVDNFYVQDSVRGALKRLHTNLTVAEPSEDSNRFTSFDSNGFTVGGDNSVNMTGHDYVAWTWKAGGTAVTNTNYLFDAEISANPDSGFSIVKTQTGTSTSAAEVQYGEFKYAHGLNQTPELVITKITSATGGWDTLYYPNGTGSTVKGGALNSTGGFYDYTIGTNFVGINSTFVHAWDYPSANTSPGVDIITYNFHSVDGYQKVGSYTGDGGSSNAVNLGFQPKFLMVKLISSSGQNWYIMDDQRENTSVEKALSANLDSAEESLSGHLDFTSTGFTLTKNSSAFNTNGSTYLYLAIAK